MPQLDYRTNQASLWARRSGRIACPCFGGAEASKVGSPVQGQRIGQAIRRFPTVAGDSDDERSPSAAGDGPAGGKSASVLKALRILKCECDGQAETLSGAHAMPTIARCSRPQYKVTMTPRELRDMPWILTAFALIVVVIAGAAFFSWR
jgi:hypothetical protein